MQNKKGEIIIYKTKSGETKIEAKLENETVWLSLNQITELLGRDKSVISRHIKNIFEEGELDKNSVVAKFATTASDGKMYNVEYYNLDAIISVGYRVKSFEGTRFRIWATEVLKDHLIKGYTINEKRLQQREIKLTELEKVIRLFQSAKNSKLLSQSEADGLLQVITEYADSWILLQKYDEGKIETKKKKSAKGKILSYDKIKKDISELKRNMFKKKEAADIFGVERSHGLEAILGNLNQTFSGRALYPTVEEKAAHLLYFVIKDHPFVDGNKRIGSFLFIAYLFKNNYLLDKNGEKKINDNALVALALLIAQSNPKDKEIMIALVTNLL